MHAACDGKGRPVRLHLTAGQVSDFKGADMLLVDLPDETKEAIGDYTYDCNKIRFSEAHTGDISLDVHIPCGINLKCWMRIVA